MREEDKIITIFAKNGISILKYIDRSHKNMNIPFAVYRRNDIQTNYYNNYTQTSKSIITIKKESKLGFYYTKKEEIYDDKPNINNQDLSKM